MEGGERRAPGGSARSTRTPRALPGASRDDQGVPTRMSPHLLRRSGCRAGPGHVTSPRSPPPPSRQKATAGPERSPGSLSSRVASRTPPTHAAAGTPSARLSGPARPWPARPLPPPGLVRSRAGADGPPRQKAHARLRTLLSSRGPRGNLL